MPFPDHILKAFYSHYQLLSEVLTISNTICNFNYNSIVIQLQFPLKRGNTSFFLNVEHVDPLFCPQKECTENDLCLELFLPNIFNGGHNLDLKATISFLDCWMLSQMNCKTNARLSLKKNMTLNIRTLYTCIAVSNE